MLLTGSVFFAWGEIYSLFPATCGDTYGSKYATTNAGLLYTAKGTASLLVPFANVLTEWTGSWHAVFITASLLNVAAGMLALFVLKPMRAAQTQRSSLAEEAAMSGASALAAATDDLATASGLGDYRRPA